MGMEGVIAVGGVISYWPLEIELRALMVYGVTYLGWSMLGGLVLCNKMDL